MAERRGRVLSPDEMTGVQALERLPPSLPMRPGQVERRAYAYPRHGTLSVSVSRDGATGQVVAPSCGPTRAEADCGAPLRGVVATDPQVVRWPIVTDNVTIPCAESLVRDVAEVSECRDEWGVKGASGILKGVEARAAFLSDASRRVVFHSTPKPASGMNRVEIWFRILAREVLERGNFTSVEDLKARGLAFIASYNRTMAKPFRGNYGKTLQT